MKQGGQSVAYENCTSNWQQKVQHKGSIHNNLKVLINNVIFNIYQYIIKLA